MREAEALGANLVEVERLHLLQRTALLEQFAAEEARIAEQAAAAQARIADESHRLFEQVVGDSLGAANSIAGFLGAQSLSSTSTLSPAQQLVESQRQFSDLLGRVRGGELGLTGSLTQSANTLLGLGQQNFASTVDFANIEQFVRSSLFNLSDDILADSFIDRQNELIVEQTAVGHDDSLHIIEELEMVRREIQLLRQQQAA